MRDNAVRSVKAQLILDAIAEAEELSVGDAELTEYLVRQASRYNMSPQDFANEVLQNGNLPALISDVRRNKALAAALSVATVTDSSGNPVDLSALTPQALSELADAENDLSDFDDDEHGHDQGHEDDDHSGHDHAGHDHGDHAGHDHG